MDFLVPRLWSFTRRRIGLRRLAMIGLLIAIQLNLILGLNNFIRGLKDEQGWLINSGFLAIWLGWETGRKRINWRSSWGLGILIGIIIQFFHFGRWGEPLFSYINSFLYGIRVLVDRTLPIEPALISLEINAEKFSDAILHVLVPLQIWVKGLTAGEAEYNKIATLLIWSLFLWFLAYWSGWSLRRFAKPVVSLLPEGIVLAGIFSYSGQEGFLGLAGFLGLTFMTMGVNEQYFREQDWVDRKVDYAEDLRLDVLTGLSAVVLVLTVVSATAPILTIKPIKTWFVNQFSAPRLSESSRGRFGESLGIDLPVPTPLPIIQARGGGMPRSHLLGSGPDLEKEVVMIVQVEGINSSLIDRFYWRGLTYDTYIGLGWETGETIIQQYAEGKYTNQNLPVTQRVIRQKFEFIIPQNNFIYAAGDILTLDWPFSISWRLPVEGEEPADQFAGLVRRDSYQVDSVYPNTSVEQLRNTEPGLPQWVLDRYLALPEGIPARVFELAGGLGVDSETTYDKTVAIERYLRSFPYTLDLPAPPLDRDVVDYFLFDLQRGYCDYYASAMVVLARASGIPARLAVGYTAGAYDAANAEYIVTAANAHSWVEIYFNGIGWVNFEPTGGQPELIRAETFLEDEGVKEPLLTTFTPLWLRTVEQIGKILLGLALLTSFGLFLWYLYSHIRLRRLSPDQAISQLFYRLKQVKNRLSVPARTGDTPYESSEAFVRHLAALFQGQKIFFQTDREIRMLTEFYVKAVYSPKPLNEIDQKVILKTWRRIELRLWWAIIQKKRQWRRKET